MIRSALSTLAIRVSATASSPPLPRYSAPALKPPAIQPAVLQPAAQHPVLSRPAHRQQSTSLSEQTVVQTRLHVRTTLNATPPTPCCNLDAETSNQLARLMRSVLSILVIRGSATGSSPVAALH